MRRERIGGVVTAVVVISAAWTILAVWIAPKVTPTIPGVMAQMWSDRWYYGPHVLTTLNEASWGWLWGNAIAISIGTMIVVSGKSVSALLEKFSVAIYAVPLLAIGPILEIVTRGATTKIALAALGVFFTTTVMWTLGLRSADPAMMDVVHAAGGGRWSQYRRVRIQAALPSLFAGLQIAAPAAVLGAIIGEYLGGSRGLGVAMIQAQSSFEVPRTWGLAIVIAVLVGIVYAITGLIGRKVTPWAGKVAPIAVLQFGSDATMGRVKRLWLGLLSGLLLIALWWLILDAFNLNRYFAYRPNDVIEFFANPRTAAERSLLYGAVMQTVVDTGVGFIIGLVASVGVAIVVVLSHFVDRIVTPIAIALRSLPIIAMTPLITLIFGRGLGSVTVIVSLVTFFPTLVAVIMAMRNAPTAACEVVIVYGGSKLRQLRQVRIPFAIPTFFSAARIALPAAIAGALLAEWLATGKGLGSLMLLASASSRFGIVWSGAVLVVVASMLSYSFVGFLESHVARRLEAGSG